jgi:uncharacterized protein YeaO (DUF488 family)
MKAINIKRVYEPPSPEDGYRLLVDRMWPRGLSRRRAALDGWARDLAPSDELRRWYGHAPERFDEFARRYRSELESNRPEINALGQLAAAGQLTLVFAARDSEHSNAAVLVEVLTSAAQVSSRSTSSADRSRGTTHPRSRRRRRDEACPRR